VDRADVQLRLRGEGGDADLPVGAGQRLEEIECPVDRLDRAPGPARLGCFFHGSQFHI